jgi:hypothetical protein
MAKKRGPDRSVVSRDDRNFICRFMMWLMQVGWFEEPPGYQEFKFEKAGVHESGEKVAAFSLSEKQATDEEGKRERTLPAEEVAEEILRCLEGDQVAEMFRAAVVLGMQLATMAHWPTAMAELKRLSNKRAAADESRTHKAQRARELLAAEKERAGRHFNRTAAIKTVAKEMDVSSKTVGRWLNNSKGQL